MSASLVLSAACARTAKPAPTTGPTRVSSIAWRSCDDGFDCATLAVPLDWADPAGTKINLALIRLPTGDPARRIGSLLVNPGGPGGSGVDMVRDAAMEAFPQEIRDRFDIVGFDPRGVGASTPAVACLDDPGAYISGIHSGDETQQRNLDRLADAGFAAACAEHSGGILGYLSAPHVAHDMEELRIALGEPKLTYVGFSYGTLLGATYADLFPSSVRALVLDGALDPSLTPEQHGARQDDGFDQALTSFLADCADHNSCPFNNHGQPENAFDDLFSRIENEPLPATASGDSRMIDVDTAWTGVSAALYDRAHGWPVLAKALALADRDGDGSGLLALADGYYERASDGSYSNTFDAHIAINCVDAPRRTGEQTGTPAANAPTATPTDQPWSSPCDFWPVKPDRTPAPIRAIGAPPILVIGTTGDPATPYRESRAMADQLRSGRLLTYRGEGHTAYGSGNDCIDHIVDAYLIRLEVPAYGTECEQN